MTHLRKFERAGDSDCRWVDQDSNGRVEYGDELGCGPTTAALRFLEEVVPITVI